MITNRELGMDDYLAMLRRQAKVILIPALLAPLAGYLISHAFPAKYTSQATVLIQGQQVPESMVQSLVSGDTTARVNAVREQVKSQSVLLPVVERVYPGKSVQEAGEIMDTIRANFTIEQAPTDLTPAAPGASTKGSGPAKKPTSAPPAFYVKYTASNKHEAQQICNEMTTLVIQEYTKQIAAAAGGTSTVLNLSIDDAKNNLDSMDAKLAEFKKQNSGQLPGDEDVNLKNLLALSTQLDSSTQSLNRAEQDKTYFETLLAQQLAAWKSSQSSTNPDTLQKQMSELQAQLLQLQAKYTPDHPDVIKAKADIAEVKKKLNEINSAAAEATDANNTDKGSLTEPPEIRQLRLQIHQYGEQVSAGTRDQKRLQQQIAALQSRLSLSPAIEEQYKQLTRDYDNAQRAYNDLLAKRSSADLSVKMNNQAEGERMFPVEPAELPESPSFPNRLLFAAGGLGAGLAIGVGLALWREIRDTSIRTEGDAEAVLQLPTLIAIPWVSLPAPGANNSKLKFWKRDKHGDKAAIGA